MFSQYLSNKFLIEALDNMQPPEELVDLVYRPAKDQFLLRFLKSIQEQKQHYRDNKIQYDSPREAKQTLLAFQKLIKKAEEETPQKEQIDKTLINLPDELLQDWIQNKIITKKTYVPAIFQKPMIWILDHLFGKESQLILIFGQGQSEKGSFNMPLFKRLQKPFVNLEVNKIMNITNYKELRLLQENILPNMLNDLKVTISHELEHYLQYRVGVLTPKENGFYYTSDAEYFPQLKDIISNLKKTNSNITTQQVEYHFKNTDFYAELMKRDDEEFTQQAIKDLLDLVEDDPGISLIS